MINSALTSLQKARGRDDHSCKRSRDRNADYNVYPRGGARARGGCRGGRRCVLKINK